MISMEIERATKCTTTYPGLLLGSGNTFCIHRLCKDEVCYCDIRGCPTSLQDVLFHNNNI